MAGIATPARAAAEHRWSGGTSWALGTFAILSISLVATLIDSRLWHWFMLPVSACGVMVAVDVVKWARKQLDVFDPQALIGLFGFHFFYAAPLLHVLLDYWLAYINPLPDWRHGLGVMASINAAGLVFYRVIIGLKLAIPTRRASATVDETRFVRFGKLAVGVGVAGFAIQVATFGGINGYLSAASDNREALAGTGWLLLIGESFPLMGFVVLLVCRREMLSSRPKLLGWAIALFATTQFLVGGLRGSRSNTIWPVLIGLIVVHLAVRPIRRRQVVALGIIFVGFMYGYGVYKSAGSEILRANGESVGVTELSTETGRTLPAMFLGDLGRSDIQAVILERQRKNFAPLSYGATYLGAVGFLVPDAVQPKWVVSKVAAGTDMLYGEGTADAGGRSSRIYGLAGEAMLNFGVVGAVASFAVLGAFIGSMQCRYQAASVGHLGTKLFAALICVCGILALGSDLDNIAWFLVKTGLPLAAVVFLARRSTREVRPE